MGIEKLARRCRAVVISCHVVSIAWAAAGIGLAADALRGEHPLLPGVRTPEVWNSQWPSTLHDKLLTAFSPLKCSARRTPRVWATIDPGGVVDDAVFLPNGRGGHFLLVQDSGLRRIDALGRVVWHAPGTRALFYEQLHGDGAWTLGVQWGQGLALIDPATGQSFWHERIHGTLGPDKVRVGRLRPDYPGKQIAVFPQYATSGYLFAFPAGQRAPKLVWKTEEAVIRDWPSVADHGVATLLEPDGSVIWNIRHHTINCHDARTGRRLRQFGFNSGGSHRRNYGPSVLGSGPGGSPLLAVLSHSVEHHATVFSRNPAADPVLVFDQSYAYCYDPGNFGTMAQFEATGMGDADGDGVLDIVYSDRRTQPKFQTRTLVCEANTGRQRVIPDMWLAAAIDLDGDGKKEIFCYDDPAAEMPNRGMLHLYRFDGVGKLVRVHTLPNAQLALRAQSGTEEPAATAWCCLAARAPIAFHTPEGTGVLVKDFAARRAKLLHLCGGKVLERPAPAAVMEAKVLAAGQWTPDGPWLWIAQPDASGRLVAFDQEGRARFEIPVPGGALLASAADLDRSGRCQLAVLTAQHRVKLFSLDREGRARNLFSVPFIGAEGRLSVPLRDVDGDGRPDVLGSDYAPNGRLRVRLHAGDGKVLWESALSMPGSGELRKWIIGDFFGPGHPGVFVSAGQGLSREESYMLDGKDGHIVWIGQPQNVGGTLRTCNPCGIPTVFDADGDRKEDLMLDYRDFVATHRGCDGALLRQPTGTGAAFGSWAAYNSFIPVYKQGENRPHFLLPLGYGEVGLVTGDLKTSLWSHRLGYDMPANVGMVDVDGDGRLEIGYENQRDGWFLCRDLWTGKERWRLKLAGEGYGPVVSADLDGDGKGEFLIGNYCIGTDAQGRGQIRWQLNLPVGTSWSAIADLDGDGLGELVMLGADGLVYVLKGNGQ